MWKASPGVLTLSMTDLWSDWELSFMKILLVAPPIMDYVQGQLSPIAMDATGKLRFHYLLFVELWRTIKV